MNLDYDDFFWRKALIALNLGSYRTVQDKEKNYK
jgi:hypothetical protein